jgi:TonB family protein
MKVVVLLSAFCFLLSCAQRTEYPPPPPREAIAVAYVRADKLPVHTTTSDASPVITTYAEGETVSVMSKKGDWTEVRTSDGSGWVHASDLGENAKEVEADNLSPRFRRAPMPVSQPGAHGEIVLEADVNSDGDVTAVRILSNSTGSQSLADNNAEALRQAHFLPIVQHGQRRNFQYEHRVHY